MDLEKNARTSADIISTGVKHWRATVCDLILELDVDIDVGKPFSAALQQHAIGPIGLSRIGVSSRQTIRRTRQTIAKAKSAQFEFVIIRRGVASFTSPSSDVSLQTGDSMLIHSGEPYSFSTSDDSETYAFHFPINWLANWVRSPEDQVGKPIRAQSPWGNALLAACAGLPRSADDRPELHNLCANHVAGAISLALDVDDVSETFVLRKHATHIRRLMEAHYHDPYLDAGTLAQRHGVSLRYLHKILASAGTTYSAELSRVRLERARSLLADRMFDELSISEIAWRCGFKDASHFSRRFRSEFQLPPGAYRFRKDGILASQ